ncbi:MAG: acyltransferase [Verrucomicrobia bacterium]|nr:acyltransferase [Verrucomicrobiota bacterium]
MAAPDPGALKEDGTFVAVDVLRGLSALAVALFHVRIHLWVGYRAIQENPSAYSAFDRLAAQAALPVTQMGYAVMLFFVLSGFCIHWAYARPNAPALELGTYTRRRLGRIVPAYVVTVLLCFAVEAVVTRLGGPPPSSPQVSWSSLFLLQTYLCAGDQLLSNASLWSIPLELELYAVYPLALWLARRRGMGASLLLAGGVSASAALALTQLPPDRAWLAVATFPKYWIIWMSGAWLAERTRHGTLPPFRGLHGTMAFALLALALLCERWHVPSPYRHFLWGALSFLVLWYFLTQPAWFTRLPRGLLGPFVQLGAISYSLYLLHFPLFYLLSPWYVSRFGGKPANFLVSAAFVGLAVAVAWLFHRLVEAPSHRWARGGKP